MDKGIQGLTINIIYVKDTPKLLLSFLSSLIFYTDCRYRLIGNGCSLEDEVLLKSFVQKEERASFFSMESEDMLKHHEVLHCVLTIDRLVKKRRLSEKLLVQHLVNKSTTDSNTYLKKLPNEVVDNIRKARPQIQHASDVFSYRSSNTNIYDF